MHFPAMMRIVFHAKNDMICVHNALWCNPLGGNMIYLQYILYHVFSLNLIIRHTRCFMKMWKPYVWTSWPCAVKHLLVNFKFYMRAYIYNIVFVIETSVYAYMIWGYWYYLCAQLPFMCISTYLLELQKFMALFLLLLAFYLLHKFMCE